MAGPVLLPVTEMSIPEGCEVCRDSAQPGILLAWMPGCDEEPALIFCPHCTGSWRLLEILEGKK